MACARAPRVVAGQLNAVLASEASLAARTDQTKLCRDCVARFGGIVCPACGIEPAFDLSRAADRQRATAWIRQKHPDALPFRVRIGRPSAIVGTLTTLGVVALGAVSGHWVAWAAAAGCGAVLAVRLALGARRGTSGARSRDPQTDMTLIGVVRPALPETSAERIVRSGAVKCDDPLLAPLSGERCVAYRLMGRVGDCVVDDAAAAPFTLVVGDGPSVAVLASAAIIELPVHSVSVVAGAAERVRRFLGERGLNALATPALLTEGLLREGDEIVVEGTLETIASGAGYRGRAASDLITGRSDSPVVIRRM